MKSKQISRYIETALERELRQYRVKSEGFFDYLKKQSISGFNKSQFVAFRVNFFYRTAFTAISVCKVVESAALNQDYDTLAEAGKNLFEEAGEGSATASHLALLRHTFSKHGRVVFNVNQLNLEKCSTSHLLLPEVFAFREAQEWCYSNCNYLTVLGTSFAQESAANQMLENFYNFWFLPYKKRYLACEDFNEVAKYFLVHIQGLEDEHASNAKKAILRRCKSISDLRTTIEGANTFLVAQSNLWDAIHRQLVSLTNCSAVVESDALREFRHPLKYKAADIR